ncbi:MAG: 2-amino-4-hydroxy-6-hydroxymethyldihydropteridine diphosphokinase [Gammaproteobacteria bacterium]
MLSYYLSLGSNINPKENITSAIRLLKSEFQVTNISNFYLTAASGFEGEDFINGCIEISGTDKNFEHTESLLKSIEDDFGRDRSLPKFSNRPLDIDIVLALQGENLIYISKEIQLYDFVSIPLREILSTKTADKLELAQINNASFKKVEIYL